MKLLPSWTERIRDAEFKQSAHLISYCIRKSTYYYSARKNFVETSEQAQSMLDFALQRPLSHIGFDAEFRYDRPGIRIDKNNTVHDPRSIRPLLLSLAMVEPCDGQNGQIYSFVIDFRKPELLPFLRQLFRIPVTFCAHYAKAELLCLLKLGLPAPHILWDTFIFERAASLGRNHRSHKASAKNDEIEQILIKKAALENEKFSLSLVATCQRYGLSYRMETGKKRLQKTFLTHGDSDKFSEEQIAYAAEDALATAQLYPQQISKAVQMDLIHHCLTVEMPWTKTNARIEWQGVGIDLVKRERLIEIIKKHKVRLGQHLAEIYGIQNINSHKQLQIFFSSCGLLDHFKRNGKISFDKNNLKKNAHIHPAVVVLMAARRASDLLTDRILSTEFISDDGRIRAEHKQLGTDTGRQTSRWPNILGLDRILRPLIIPEPGYGIGEVDWSQVEVGVAGAVYDDGELVRMFNSGDVYSAMAQHFYQDILPEEALHLSGKEFKVKYKQYRNEMKSCTLGIIYGITPAGLAQALKTSKDKAAELQERFMDMFPELKSALNSTAHSGIIRGYASGITGLKRFRARYGKAGRSDANWLINYPVQGSAAVIFKAVGNRLDRLYRVYDARIIIPLHDSFVFEAPLDMMKEVSEVTSRVMCEVLQEYFPVLKPTVDVNIANPKCWNKDGIDDELERWISDLDDILNVSAK